jgi:Amidohydrolase family
MRLYPEANRLGREEALRLYTAGSSWFSAEEGTKGHIAPGRLADLAVLSADYLTVPEVEIKGIESLLTIVGGKVVYGAQEFSNLAPPPLPVSPDWSPVASYGGYHHGAAAHAALHSSCSCGSHRQVWLQKKSRFWGLGCDCFAF